MTKFNPDLIAKARKGEIAILNDGSVEELREVLKEVWPEDLVSGEAGGVEKYYFAIRHTGQWTADSQTNLPAYSIKDFFMPDTKDTPIFRKENEGHQPRTYRVTRQQMKEVYDLITPAYTERFRAYVNRHFEMWNNEVVLDEGAIGDIIGFFEPGKVPDLLKSIFPSYFFIPEGEPVLCRDNDGDDWLIFISDGTGAAYARSRSYGTSTGWKQIIPFTKNPPK